MLLFESAQGFCEGHYPARVISGTIYGTTGGKSMCFDQTLLNDWSKAKDERQNKVLDTLEAWGFTLANRQGSHFTFEHDLLAEIVSNFYECDDLDNFLRSGRLVVVCHHNKVHEPYLKRIVKACNLIKRYSK